MNNLRLVADNGGGFTLQIVSDDCEYQHCYDCVTQQTAVDVLAAINGDDISTWTNNSAESWIDPMQDEIDNGGYQMLETDCHHAVIEWGNDSSWANVVAFTDFFINLVNAQQYN